MNLFNGNNYNRKNNKFYVKIWKTTQKESEFHGLGEVSVAQVHHSGPRNGSPSRTWPSTTGRHMRPCTLQ